LLTLVIALTACGEPQRFAALPPGTTVLAFGDSITYGVGAAAHSSYPTQLAASTGWQVWLTLAFPVIPPERRVPG
jgi:acyl-CoA hydrolase